MKNHFRINRGIFESIYEVFEDIFNLYKHFNILGKLIIYPIISIIFICIAIFMSIGLILGINAMCIIIQLAEILLYVFNKLFIK